MQRGSHRSMGRLNQKASFPSLKASLILSKGVLAVSKVDLDSRIINRDSIQIKTQPKLAEHIRTYSGVSAKTKPKPTLGSSRISDKAKSDRFERMKPGESLFDTQAQISRAVNVEKSRISSKGYGMVKAYAANSHPGPLNTINQDRVCIVTNLNKTSNKASQVSFFAIYDGHNGACFADFMRDRFHTILIEDQMFWKDLEMAIRNTVKKVEHSFFDDPKFHNDTSSVSFVILIFLGQTCYCAQMGEPRAIISRKLGSEKSRGSQRERQTASSRYKNRSSSLKKLKNNDMLSRATISNIQGLAQYGRHAPTNNQYRAGKEISISMIGLDDSIDFIIMGSEGVFEAYKEHELMRKAWMALLTPNLNSAGGTTVHMLTGDAVNHLMNDILNGYSTKNVSIILLSFEPVADVVKPDEKLDLPYISFSC